MHLLRRFLVLLMKRIFKFLHGQQLIVPIVLFAAGAFSQGLTGHFSIEALKKNPWAALLPYIVACGALLIGLIGVAAKDLNRELEEETRKQREAVRLPEARSMYAQTVSKAPGYVLGTIFALFVITLEAFAWRAAYPVSGHTEDGLIVSVFLVNPTSPAIIENHSDTLADRVTWELVMFRKNDDAFLSYLTQEIGYIKPHSRSAPYEMNLNSLPHAPGGGQLVDGDVCAGSLVVDCPSCRAITVAIGFVWGHSGWFYELPRANGKLLKPKEMSPEMIRKFVDLLTTTTIESNARRQPIKPIH